MSVCKGVVEGDDLASPHLDKAGDGAEDGVDARGAEGVGLGEDADVGSLVVRGGEGVGVRLESVG